MEGRRSASTGGPAQKCSLSILKGSGIALTGSLRVSNGGALGKSCMQK